MIMGTPSAGKPLFRSETAPGRKSTSHNLEGPITIIHQQFKGFAPSIRKDEQTAR